jgi:hypothetical protein
VIAMTLGFMLVGISAGTINKVLKVKAKSRHKGEAIMSALLSVESCRALIAGPVIYAGIYSFIKVEPDVVMNCIFAFQTGYCCDSILRSTAIPAPPGGER